MTKSRLLAGVLVPVLAFIVTSSHAALLPRLGGLAYYDDVLDITWLADANLAASNTFGTADVNADGSMRWDTATTWIENMNASAYLGLDNWRLPSADVNGDGAVVDCSGGGVVGCDDNEMGHLYWEQGITDASPGPFENIEFIDYWFGTEFTPTPMGSAYVFRFANGAQNIFSKTVDRFAWAVHPGDVAVVPVPAAVWLFGSGLLGLIGIVRRKKAV